MGSALLENKPGFDPVAAAFVWIAPRLVDFRMGWMGCSCLQECLDCRPSSDPYQHSQRWLTAAVNPLAYS